MTAGPRSVAIHGHFYQPPRSDPWTGEVPVEPSAAPFHDWNHRVHDECYRAVVAARIQNGDGGIAAVVNALEWISWDAGPTLLEWMARETPDTYRAFLAADAASMARLGHGNALAAPYHHVILPLATRRDKVTEVRWGIADFRRRFGREPEGMWLPEAAVDTETLEVLAEEGIAFTVLGPGQVVKAPPRGMPGRVKLPSGRRIAVFVYDGGLSHDVAFGSLLRDASTWTHRMADEDGNRRLVTLATDGETFGHHHRWGDMALAAALLDLSQRTDVRLDNLASFLAHNPPTTDVRVVEPTSWSCAHGVERWRSECGCRMDTSRPPRQGWRTVLREALDELATDLHALFGTEGGGLLGEPWEARDAYGAVFDQGEMARRRFVEERARRPLGPDEVERVLSLLEMERDALRMYTSCGWFFDDLSGLEPLQVLRYAAHALDLAGAPAAEWEPRIRKRLAQAETLDDHGGTLPEPVVVDGATLWDRDVRARPAWRETAAARWEAGNHDAPAGDTGLLAATRRFIREPGDDTAQEVVRRSSAAGAAGIAVPFDAQTALGRALPDTLAVAPAATRAVARALGFSPDAADTPPFRSAGPVSYVFALHVHQPVGHFDAVFDRHADEVYLPLLRRLAERGALPAALHVSGPLLEWMDAHGHAFLDLVGRLASEGSIELLLAGFYEPVLPVLSRADRLEQIGWMREWLHGRFGVDATGLWLTERVWEPGLAEDLAEAGVTYAMVDDRHFLVTGYQRRQLHRPWHTESGGRGIHLFPIDERLRSLVPFRPPEELADYLRALQARGRRLAVLADEGEKFGGWPGTAEWVWERGWLDRYLDTLDDLRDQGIVRLASPTEALGAVPAAGPAYLPTASYREMEGWSLPPAAARRMERLEHLVAESSDDAEATSVVRGGHWRNFLARYSESNRMHKKAAALSALCRGRGDPQDARRAVGRAQCNDAYWHGAFGGLYLRHLRRAVWANLAEAEGILRRGESLAVEVLDLDGDGREEVWIHSDRVSALVAPARGGVLEELTGFESRANLADVLTRRRESYHRVGRAESDGPDGVPAPESGYGAMPSIHDLEEEPSVEELPPVDLDDRAILVDRVLGAEVSAASYEAGGYEPLASWAGVPLAWSQHVSSDAVTLEMRSLEGPVLEKSMAVGPDGLVTVSWRWDPSAYPADARFASELSLARDVELEMDPPPKALWRYEIRTVAKSERVAEESVQGVSLTPLWPASAGEARLSFRWS